MREKLADKLALDLKKLSKHHLISNLSEHLNVYEKRVKNLVHDFDLRSRDAREKSRKQIDRFVVRLREARGNVEHKVAAVLNTEGQRLNKSVSDLLNYLKTVSNNEKLAVKTTQSPAKRKSKAASSARKTSSKKATRSRTKSSSQSSASA